MRTITLTDAEQITVTRARDSEPRVTAAPNGRVYVSRPLVEQLDWSTGDKLRCYKIEQGLLFVKAESGPFTVTVRSGSAFFVAGSALKSVGLLPKQTKQLDHELVKVSELKQTGLLVK